MSDEEELVSSWEKRISEAEEAYKPYHNLIEKIRDFYAVVKGVKNPNNIFWSSIETMKPFLYFKQPKIYIEMTDKSSGTEQKTAALILEKALEWDLQQFDFDSVIKYARNDFLLCGCGILWSKYSPKFKKISNNGQEIELKEDEVVETEYVSPEDFIADSEKVNVWEDVRWVARKTYMTINDAKASFGDIVDECVKDEPGVDEKDKGKKSVCVYEIWDKSSKKIYWYAKESKDKFLKYGDAALNLNNFFPFPKPIFATLANKGVIPTPDYTIIEGMIEELNGVTDRMRLTMKALKVSGAYNNAFPELASIMNKDITLVALSDFTKLKEMGGIAGAIDFLPIAQYIQALEALSQRRDDLIRSIYDITGVSDIMRGNSDPGETATAVTKKTNFGTLRNQDRQNDMQRFIKALLQIKAEIICEMFDAQKLAKFADKNIRPEVLAAAIQILKSDKLRGMTLDVETDTSFMQDQTAQKTIEAVRTVSELINSSFKSVSAQPLLLPVFQKMVESIVFTLPNSRQFADVIDDSFNKIAEQLNQPQQPQPNPEMIKAAAQEQKNQQEYEVKKEQNKLKSDELALKQEEADAKIAMQNKEAEMQYDLTMQKMALGQPTNANITTGYVRSFDG